jgi:hypothetical protein
MQCTADEISKEITQVSLVSFGKIADLYTPFVQDPNFKLDKLRIISDFKQVD